MILQLCPNPCSIPGISSTIATTAFSKLSSGTVGFFYLNADDTVARFGYVDSNGRRQDVVTPVDRIQSQGENRLYIKLNVTDSSSNTNSPVNLKLFHSHGLISDVGKFNQIL